VPPGSLPLVAALGLPPLQAEPERLRAELEQYLTQLGVQYKYSTTTKFANFRNRTLE
jgi:hypothetical protein